VTPLAKKERGGYDHSRKEDRKDIELVRVLLGAGQQKDGCVITTSKIDNIYNIQIIIHIIFLQTNIASSFRTYIHQHNVSHENQVNTRRKTYRLCKRS
jgi:hypothetical protein